MLGVAGQRRRTQKRGGVIRADRPIIIGGVLGGPEPNRGLLRSRLMARISGDAALVAPGIDDPLVSALAARVEALERTMVEIGEAAEAAAAADDEALGMRGG